MQARLDACVFKGPVKNEQTGAYEEVPMCCMNEQKWGSEYARRLADPALLAEPQVKGARERKLDEDEAKLLPA